MMKCFSADLKQQLSATKLTFQGIKESNTYKDQMLTVRLLPILLVKREISGLISLFCLFTTTFFFEECNSLILIFSGWPWMIPFWVNQFRTEPSISYQLAPIKNDCFSGSHLKKESNSWGRVYTLSSGSS